MKRDMELIIEILKRVEQEKTATNNIVIELEGYDFEVVQYHVGLLKDAGFLKAKATYNPLEYWISEMSWAGYDFLDAARNETVVEKAKEIAKKQGVELYNLPIAVIKDLLITGAKNLFT
ncbi:DUF2513 domain-containing protein [Brevibacillus porteri]|uniref:DUF2513 domain-containing protein n=1 Tax=Brevibacillus porteri TaxID=2126350 RepID=UPI0003610C49|nr:DUF2513 domain-containing protein [Brevibacillus brevis X23]